MVTPAPIGMDADHLSPSQLVEHINALNPTATPEFLHRFDRGALIEYLRHLLSTEEPRGTGRARWIRSTGAPAVSRWEPRF